MPLTTVSRALVLGATASTAALSEVVLDSGTHVSLGGVVAVGAIVCGWAIWLGREFQKIKDRDDAVRERLLERDRTAKEQFERLESLMHALPCRVDCPRDEK